MKRIDEYIEKIYRDLDAKDEDTEILKEEIREHLYDKVADCMKDGYTKEQSIDLAIKNFGDEASFSKEMKSIIVNQTKFTSILLKLSIIIFIIGCLLKVGGWYSENQYTDNYEKTRGIITLSEVKDQIKQMLIQKDELLEKDKKDIDNILNNYNDKYENGLYNIRILKDNVVYYEYNRTVPAELLDSGIGRSMFDNWVIERHQTDTDMYRNALEWQSKADIKNVSNSLHFKLKNLGFWLISLSWILIVMYYTQKAILNDKLNRNIIVLLSLQTVFIYATYTSDKDIIMPTVALFMLFNAIYPKIIERLHNKKLLSV